MNNKRVLFIPSTPWASGYYRMLQPAGVLRKMGYDIDATFFNTLNPSNLTALSIYTDNEINLLDYDIHIFQMIWHEALNSIINQLRKKDKVTVHEVDDDYNHLPANNPSFLSFHPKCRLQVDENGKKFFNLQAHQYKQSYNRKIRDRKAEPQINFTMDNLKKAMSNVDILQVSTPELAQAYAKYNNNIVVLENSIDNKLYDDVIQTEKSDKITIGWFGTKTHIDDLRIVSGTIPENAKLLIAGFPEVFDATPPLFSDHMDVEILPPYKLEELPTIVKRCDIGIVPLEDIKFNQGKSDLKGVEFGAGGVPVVASDVAPYRRWIRHGENGYLVSKNKTKFWVRYLNELVNNKELREHMSKEAKKDAVKRDIRTYIHKWIEVYFK